MGSQSLAPVAAHRHLAVAAAAHRHQAQARLHHHPPYVQAAAAAHPLLPFP
jgi:hypothetical protein